MNGWGIRARVFFLALAPSVMILLVLVVYFTYQRIAEVDLSLAERGKLVARRLAPSAEFALFAGDRAGLQRLAEAAGAEADVAGIDIDDASGQQLVRTGRADAGALRFTEPITQTRVAVGDFPEQAQVDAPPPVLGRITVSMSHANAERQQRRLLLSGLALGLAGLAFAIVLALLVGNTVIHPIRRLARAMGDLRRGEPAPPLPTAGGGELATLAEGFNRMAASLRADARELENRVREATAALLVERDAAEQATRAKSRFIAAASHDLRQPLHAIGLFTSTLQRRTEGTELRAVAEDLAKAVGVMDRQFRSLLDISRLDAGTMRVNRRPFPLARLFAQIVAEYADAAAQKRLRLTVRPSTAIVMSDELLVHRILGNLVANAIRYTASGGVMVACRRRGDDVEIQVRDSGIGIARERQSDIFLEFFQIGDGDGDRATGLGLGLAIVARLARLLGTAVTLRSAPGRGSVFSLRLPCAAHGDEVATPARQDAGDARRGPPVTVLVVDDDPLVVAGSRAVLEDLGCSVRSAGGTAEALAAVRAHAGSPLLVLCDMWLAPGENGIDLLRRIHELTVARISGLLVSGDTGPETQAAAAAAGYPLLHKPVSPAKLRAAVMSLAWQAETSNGFGMHDENSAG
jgi:signal transduction histidine kinase/ActR/RegA family two-component response regulator